ncbi:HAD family hydrolase [Clostridium sp. MB40-C1]|uniref:HAD family hydrolase n=1 Tax=Clostridium sp. MB40-C1 TaxID=3070996 RepID=UPI0027E002CC|nr:HAD family hydrolase [Clostridium sp. MB40-C1]WMJ80470.1 HAD family hydrolase [Clostridium sp. MB40-C1]
MIKLIATDMDGTLVSTKGTINEKIFSLIHTLNKKDIQFVAASGRFYSQLNNNFKKVKTDMLFIAHNGALIKYNNNGKILYSNSISKENLKDVLNLNCGMNELLFLAGENEAYVINPSNDLIDKFNFNEVPLVILNSFSEIESPIYKMSYYIADGVNPTILEYLKKNLNDNLEFVVSGHNWIDIMNKGINKGTAVKILQEKFKITSQNTMVFGDYYNDLPMFKVAHHSYAMKNAPEDVKKNAKFIAESNDNDGVYNVLYKYTTAL